MKNKKSLFLGVSLVALLLTSCGSTEPFDPFFGGSKNASKVPAPVTKNNIPDFDKLSILEQVAFGIEPASIQGTDYVTYGLYPQTAVTDEKIAEYIEKYGAKYSRKNWTYYDGSFYCQSKAVSMGGTTFNNGVRIETFKYYWFKLEPIVWEMVNYGNAFVSAKVLDYQVYHNSIKTRYINERNVNPNNYQYCYLREWLNSDFINLAFSLGDNYLETSDVDNSSVSTATLRANDNACQNTFDKVYVPCHRDIKDGEAVFNYELLSAKATDYAIAQGTYYNYPSYNAEYWTRSPDGTYIDTAFMMNEDSYVVTTCVDALCGVRPMISIAGNPLY